MWARLKDQSWRIRLNSRPVLQHAMHGLLWVHQLRGRKRVGVETAQQELALWPGDIIQAVDGSVWRSCDALQKFLDIPGLMFRNAAFALVCTELTADMHSFCDTLKWPAMPAAV